MDSQIRLRFFADLEQCFEGVRLRRGILKAGLIDEIKDHYDKHHRYLAVKQNPDVCADRLDGG